MGGCADKDRFSLHGLYHPNQHLSTPFSLNKVQTDNRQIILKPNNYLSSTNKIKIDGSLTRVSTKSQLQGTEGPEIRRQDGNRSGDKLDKDDLLLKQTQSHFVDQQNYEYKHLKLNQECYLLQQSVILDKKYDNFRSVPQGGQNTKKNQHIKSENKNKDYRGKDF